MHTSHTSRVRGAATLIVVMSLLMATLVAAAYASRGLVFEQRASIEQYRATQAFEAAEAGLEWALVQLNRGRLDEHCEPSVATGASTLQERSLTLDDATTGRFAASKSGAMPVCASGPDGTWRCDCPAHAMAALDLTGAQRAFRVELAGASAPAGAAAYPGIVQLAAHGCTVKGDSTATAVCAPSPMDGQAYATTTVQAALVPAVAVVPNATLTAQGRVDLGTDGALVANDQGTSFLAIDAGQGLSASTATIAGAPGAPSNAAVLDSDTALAGRSPAAVFTALFGVSPTAFAKLPAVAVVDCDGDCSEAIRRAISQGARLVWSPHDVTIGELDIGSPEHPVVLATPGVLTLQSGVRMTGVLYGSRLQWKGGTHADSWLHGAAVISGDVVLQGAPALSYDSRAIHKLHVATGSFVRVPGSWTDS